MPLTKQQIQAAAGKAEETREVQVDFWGGKVTLAKLGAGPALALGRKSLSLPKNADGSFTSEQDTVDFYVLLLANSIVGDDGLPLFIDTDGQAFLHKQPLKVLQSLAAEAVDLNGLGQVKPVEEAKKKSKAAPTGSSHSGSAKD